MTRPDRPAARFVRPGELLAVDPSALRSGPEGMFWMFGGGPMASERRGDVAIVHVRDGLEHHATWWADSYEDLVVKVTDAMSGEDALRAHADAHQYDADYQPLTASKPSAVILDIDSPGGVVAGLNECVFALQRLAKSTGVPLVAYVNELAASAAYALCCACSAVYCPPSAIVGSVGVISTMISQARKNESDGFDVVLITSGEHKADGHVHAPITSSAVEAERGRVMALAKTFWAIAGKARHLPAATVKGYEANIYLGDDAARRKLVDEVCSLDDCVLALSSSAQAGTVAALADGNETDRRAAQLSPLQRAATIPLDASRHRASPLRHDETSGRGANPMLKLRAEITRLKAQMTAENDPVKLAGLAAKLAGASAALAEAYKKTTKHVEHHETEEGDPDDKGGDGDGDDDKDKDGKTDEDDEEAAAAKKTEEDAKAEKDACRDEESEEDEKQAAVALVRQMSGGLTGPAARGALLGMQARLDRVATETARLTADANAKECRALVERGSRYALRSQVEAIASSSLKALRAFVAEAEKGSPMVQTAEGDLYRPKAEAPGTEAALPKEVRDIIDSAVEAWNGDRDTYRASLVKSHLKAHTDRLASAGNGAGRY